MENSTQKNKPLPKFVKTHTAGILDDHNLKGLSCGILWYLRSRNAGMSWFGTNRDLCRVFSDSKTAIKKSIQELQQKGYIEIIPHRDKDGRFNGQKYILNKNPQYRFDSNTIEVNFNNEKSIKTILEKYQKYGTI